MRRYEDETGSRAAYSLGEMADLRPCVTRMKETA